MELKVSLNASCNILSQLSLLHSPYLPEIVRSSSVVAAAASGSESILIVLKALENFTVNILEIPEEQTLK